MCEFWHVQNLMDFSEKAVGGFETWWIRVITIIIAQ